MSTSEVKKLYIAGPMTGLPQFNIPEFERTARRLRAFGVSVVSPVELDSPAIRNEALASTDGAMALGSKIGGETWGEILARDVRVIADTVDGIVALPDWHKSRGARLEVFVALLCNKPVFKEEFWRSSGTEGNPDGTTVRLHQLARKDIVLAIAGSFL